MTTTGNGTVRAIGYARVSTDEQGDSDAGLAVQRAAIQAECARRGWTLTKIVEDVASGKSLDGRPGMAQVLADLDAGRVDVLVAHKVDRVSRSTHDFSGLLQRAERRRWSLVALDLGVDTSTPSGELFAGIVSVIAQYERRLIASRTRDALAAKKAAGVRLGRPPDLAEAVVRRIVDDYADGKGLSAIARALTAEGIPTARGGAEWRPSTVQSVLRSPRALAMAA